MNEYLKPCPFCGGEAELISMRCEYAGERPENAQERDTYVWCPHCGFQTHTAQSDEEAVDTWNTRQTDVLVNDTFAEMYYLIQELDDRYEFGNKDIASRIQSILASVHPSYLYHNEP